tara:strand:+ start:42 stop:1355 length:1314 start_codon:yes stop_codon:yes gene_type:complete
MFSIKKLMSVIFISTLSTSVYSADLLDVYNRSLIHNNAFKTTYNDHKIAEEKYNQTASSILPEINITATSNQINSQRYTGTGVIKDYSSEGYSVNVTQPIFRLYFFDELNKSKSQIMKYDLGKMKQKKELILKSTQLYFNLIQLKNNIKTAGTKKDMMEARLKSARKLYQSGQITDITLNNHINNNNLADVELIITKNEYELAKQDIFIFTGREIRDVHDLNTEIELPNNIYEKNIVISKALSSEDNILMAQYDVDISKDTIKSNRSKHYPTLDIVASYDYSDVSSGNRIGAVTRESSTVGVLLTVPIYQGGYQSSKVKESRYQYENAKLSLDNLKRNIKKDIIAKIDSHSLMRKLISIKEINYNNMNSNYITMQKGYKSGTYSDTQIEESKYKLLEAKNEFIKSSLDYIFLDLELKRYSKKLSVKNIEAINSMLIW